MMLQAVGGVDQPSSWYCEIKVAPLYWRSVVFVNREMLNL
jgi:hypothetical protein